jgi:hypothetical protein
MSSLPKPLAFGLRSGLPENAHTAWGARLIWPNDLVWDRQDVQGKAATELRDWLNHGHLRQALDRAADLSRTHELRSSDDKLVILHETDDGVIAANPQASFGYLYVGAWLKAHLT